MKPSLFTRLLRMEGGESLHERLFRTFVASLGDGQFSEADATFVKAFAFALTGALAAAAENSETAWGQQFAERAYDLLGQQEREHGITPNRADSVTARRAVLGAKRRTLRGGSRINVENALKVLLGDAFVGWFTTPPAARVTWPITLGDTLQCFVRPGTPRKLARLGKAISVGLGAPQATPYTPLPQSATHHTLAVHDRVLVEPELLGRAEVVEVEALDPVTRSFTATFQNAHEPGSTITTMSFPFSTGNQRESVVLVPPAVALSLEWRRRIGIVMHTLLRATSTWGVAAQSQPGQAGPFLLDDPALGLLDVTPFAELTVPAP
jgi:hypothetical protein